MPISSINRVKSIIIPLAANSANVTTIYRSANLSVGVDFLPGYTVVSFNCFIKNLRAFAQITSISEAALPNFTNKDSETDKLMKTLDIEWQSQRKQLNLYIGEKTSDRWNQVGSVSLLNSYGYPYRVYNLMDLFTDTLALELGDNSRIGVEVQNVGYGLLTQEDKVTIHGSYVEEIFLQSTEVTNYYIYGSTQSSTPPTGSNNSPQDNTNPPQQEDTEMANWVIKTESYTAVAGDKIAIETVIENIEITLPINPTIGSEIKLLVYPSLNGYYSVKVNLNGNLYSGNEIAQLDLRDRDVISFIYSGETLGWIPSNFQAAQVSNLYG